MFVEDTEMLYLLQSLLAVSGLAACTAAYAPIKPCPETNNTCYFELTVEHKLTMMFNGSLVYPKNGKLYYGNENSVDRKCCR